MNYTNNRNNRRCVSRSSTKANTKQSKVFDSDTKRCYGGGDIAAAFATGNKNIVETTRDKSCIQTILDSLDGYYNNDNERLVVNEPPPSSPIQQIKPPLRNLSFSSLNSSKYQKRLSRIRKSHSTTYRTVNS